MVESFCGRDRQRAFFVDVQAFNPFAQSYLNSSLPQCNEIEKRREYDERVREVERWSFSPLVLSTCGGMGNTATVVYKRIAAMLAEKNNKPYCMVMQMPPELLPSTIFRHVPSWIKIRPPSPCSLYRLG